VIGVDVAVVAGETEVLVVVLDVVVLVLDVVVLVLVVVVGSGHSSNTTAAASRTRST
jgi:hypothetical protein